MTVDPLEQKILDPLFTAAGFSEEDKKPLKEKFYRIVFQEYWDKILTSLDKEEEDQLQRNLQPLGTPEQKIDFIKSYVSSNPRLQNISEEFFSRNVVQLILDLAGEFMKGATDEQKKHLSQLLEDNFPELQK